jgi:hypothetical protein
MTRAPRHFTLAATASLFSLALASTARARDSEGEAAAELAHTPAPEQKVHIPLPVYAEARGEGDEISRAVVRYKGPGMKNWARLEMKRLGGGWGAIIPCDVMTAGTMRYWILALDTDGNRVAGAGDAAHPFEVPVRRDIASEAPHLPGQPPPHSCEQSESPEAGPSERGQEPEPVDASDETAGEPPPYARLWIGVAGAIDVLLLPGGNDLCLINLHAVPINPFGYYCTNPDGSDFPDRTYSAQDLTLIPGNAGQVRGGAHVGDLRTLVAVDYALTPNVLLGGRVGYVLNTYPAGDAAVRDHRASGSRIHLEVRGTYVFGAAPLAHEGFAPTVFVGAGMAEFDGRVASVVAMTQKKSSLPITQPVNIWLTGGPWFVATGGGARYQLSPRAAFNAAFRVNAAFNAAGALFTFGPELAFQYGF